MENKHLRYSSGIPMTQQIKLIKLKPSLNVRPATKGLSPLTRHPFVCVECKKYRQPTNLFFQKDLSSPRRFCNCVPSKKEVLDSLSPLALSGLKAHKNKRRLHSRSADKKNQNSEEDTFYKFVVSPGNNSNLIRDMMAMRSNWKETEAGNVAHFVWQPVSTGIRYDRLMPYLPCQVVNHFEGHADLSNKLKFYRNLSEHCMFKGISVNKLVPITFEIDMKSSRYNSQLVLFSSFFKAIKKYNKKPKKSKDNPTSHNSGRNIWIMKPTSLNRGRGIQIFDSLKAFKAILASYQDISKLQKASKFVVQKYIENPLLFNNRKFDIRVWVLITHDMKGYFYKEGYLRTSSHDYSTKKQDLLKESIHLTNNAIQKEGPSYGLYETGNQLSFSDLKDFLGPEQFKRVVSKIKDLVKTSLEAVVGKLNPNKRTYCFEVFGYDFIIDSNFEVWMIECNTNPCLELSSPLLERLIPQMLEDTLTLTVDRLFKNPEKTEDNAWEFLIKITKTYI